MNKECLKCPVSLSCYGFGLPDRISKCHRCGHCELEYYGSITYYSNVVGNFENAVMTKYFVVYAGAIECTNLKIEGSRWLCDKCSRVKP